VAKSVKRRQRSYRNRPDIMKKEKTCILIDVAIPVDRICNAKEAEKKLNYKSLCIEIQRMWNMK
jgi:hypothetical protein